MEEDIIMKRNYLSVFIIALMLFVGCASVQTKDIQVDAQSDPKANFSGYKTYAWSGAAAIVNDPYGQWEPPQFDADAEIMFLINRELRKRGMSENTADPDLVIAFAAGIDMEALGLKVDSETKMDVLENVPQGGLVVVLMDSQSGFVIWVGVATAEVQESPDTRTFKARLDHAVTKMFKKLPK
jgi:PBP1b-binding outer membrane lipoprotein LpoB